MPEGIRFLGNMSVIIYTGTIGLSILAAYLMYVGLTTTAERLQNRLRIKHKFLDHKAQYVHKAELSITEQLLQQAGFPFKINAVRYQLLRWTVLLILFVNYVLIALFRGQSISIWMVLVIVAVGLISSPKMPYSLFTYSIKRWIEFRKAKRHAELFILYDLLISEIEMMSDARVNTFNLIKSLLPYFRDIRVPLQKMLINWTEKSPEEAIEGFVEELNTKEARTLGTILKTLDENTRETALEGLQSMNDLFVKSQIETYRRKRKLLVDVGSIPIKATHFLIILNFILIVVYMVVNILDATAL